MVPSTKSSPGGAGANETSPIHPSRAESLITRDNPDDFPWEGSPEKLDQPNDPARKPSLSSTVPDNPDDFE